MMFCKWIKRGVVLTLGVGLAGALLFGTELGSYAKSSLNSLHSSVRGAVPIEFELRRAQDMLDEMLPEMRANIQRIAEEEVELASLKADIQQGRERVDEERGRLALLRQAVQTEQAGYVIGGRRYEREQVVGDLARRLERLHEAEAVLAGKQRLVVQREQTLAAAEDMLDKTRSQKRLLEDKIQGLASQHRLVQAAAAGSRVRVDSSKLAQTQHLIDQIQKRLDVAERVLARESAFVQSIQVDTIDEAEVLDRVDAYLGDPPARTAEAPAEPAAEPGA